MVDDERLGVFTWDGANAKDLVSKIGVPYQDNIRGEELMAFTNTIMWNYLVMVLKNIKTLMCGMFL